MTWPSPPSGSAAGSWSRYESIAKSFYFFSLDRVGLPRCAQYSIWGKNYFGLSALQGCEVGWATPKGYEHDNLLKIYTENKLYNKLIEVDDMESDQAHFSIKAACERENWIPDGMFYMCAFTV